MNTTLLARVGAWLILATISLNYLGASYEIVCVLALLAIILGALPWLSAESISYSVLFIFLVIFWRFLPASLWHNVSPAAKLIVASGALVLIMSAGNVVRSLLLFRISRAVHPAAAPPLSKPASER